MTRLGQLHEQIISNSNDRDQTERDLGELFAIIESHTKSLNDHQLSVLARIDQVEAALDKKSRRLHILQVVILIIFVASIAAGSVCFFGRESSYVVYSPSWSDNDHHDLAVIYTRDGAVAKVTLHQIHFAKKKWRQLEGAWDGNYDPGTNRLTGGYKGDVIVKESGSPDPRTVPATQLNLAL